MPAPFRRLDAAQFSELIRLFSFTRRITAFHVHHTWIPTRAQFKGLATIEAMERAHRQRKFADIAQHITLDPDGFIWTGRSWNEPPASATGFNGTRKAGPFMMEMVGNFDNGHDPFDGAQAANAYQVVALVLRHFGLTTENVVFHREMSDKSCPGTGIDKPTFLRNVQAALDALPALAAASDEEQERDRNLVAALSGLIEPVARDAARAEDAEAELPENEETYADSRAREIAEADEFTESREAPCPSPSQLMDLIPHVINLRRGRFSADELFISNPGTVDAIFKGLDERAANASAVKPLKVVLWAHGGLVGQRGALCKAHRDLWFWQRNEDIYPLYFIWHTDLGTAIRDILLRARGGRRDLADFTSDPLIELFLHTFGGVSVWDSMKLSAAEASGTEGGARYVAARLGELVKKHGVNVELHAVGHSAGANFHSHFVPAAVEQKVSFKSLQLLAPAIRNKEFVDRVDALLGKQVQTAKIYTMRRQLERADDCVKIYRKSLLYLISKGLEIKRNEPILGLEDFLTQDAHIRERFGIKVGPKTVGEVIFSKTAGKSEATAHGCFDDDVATMNSVAATILGAPPAVSYKNTGAGKCNNTSAFESEMEVPRELAGFFAAAPVPPPPVVVDRSVWNAGPATTPNARGTGKRRALCVGINGYPTAPLHGCVADAMLWAQTLANLGFEARTLLDAAATRQGILDTLGGLLESSLPGDLVVFQFSGHGTEVDDENGDELANLDQALCPYDFNDGHLLIDDDVAELFTKIPAGVGLTCFLDNCHSGTGTRFAIGRPDTSAASGDLPRFVVADAELERKHADFRRGIRMTTRTVGSRGPNSMREVVFSACRPEELAWESNGQGDFTRNAVALLARTPTLTNAQFQQQLTAGFTPAGRQNPILDCAPAAAASSLFGFGIATTIPATLTTAPVPGAVSGAQGIATSLREIATVIERRG